MALACTFEKTSASRAALCGLAAKWEVTLADETRRHGCESHAQKAKRSGAAIRLLSEPELCLLCGKPLGRGPANFVDNSRPDKGAAHAKCANDKPLLNRWLERHLQESR